VKKPLPPHIHRHRAPDPDVLDQIAADALTFLAADPSRLGRFFDVTGLSVAHLREAAGTPAFTAHLLDYLTADAGRLTAFSVEKGYAPEAVEAIRAHLSMPHVDL
jgi:hypothetical protein